MAGIGSDIWYLRCLSVEVDLEKDLVDDEALEERGSSLVLSARMFRTELWSMSPCKRSILYISKRHKLTRMMLMVPRTKLHQAATV
jgi:hypothetical protein